MFPETPYIARVSSELVERQILPEEPEGFPSPTSERAHSAFFLLQEVCGFSLRFRFKGAFVPYAEGLENVLIDCLTSKNLLRDHWEETQIRPEDVEAIEKLAAFSEKPQEFDGDRQRWQSLLAAYVFLAYSPMYMNGRAPQREVDFVQHYSPIFEATEVGQVVRFVEAQQLQPAGT